MTRLLDELRQITHQQLNKIGSPVANMFGAAHGTLAPVVEAVTSTWLMLELDGKSYTSIDEFYAAFSSTKLPIRTILPAVDGAVVAASQTSDVATFVLKGAVALDQARSFLLAVDVGSASGTYVVVVDGREIRTGNGAAEVRIHLDAGQHVIEVLGASRVLGVKTPPDLLITAEFETLAAPVWRELRTGYLDTAPGTTANTLTWFVNPRVGGWRVLRRRLDDLALIIDLSDVESNGEFTLVLSGDAEAAVAAGGDLYAGSELVGTLISAKYVAADQVTNVRVHLDPALHGTSIQWLGRTATTGQLTEVRRISRSAIGGYVEFNDTDVVFGEYYEYALQAFGLFDPTALSALSDIRAIHAGDNEAPGAIQLDDSYPKVIDGLARVKFLTPADGDYAGVRVYYRAQVECGVLSASGVTLTLPVAAADKIGAGWTVRVVSGAGVGQERFVDDVVDGGTTTQLTVDADWIVVPDTGSSLIVFADSPVKTDYGVPNSHDDFTFEPIDTSPDAEPQLYHFRTFDKTAHEQSDQDCETWEFDPASGTISALYANLEIELINSTPSTIQLKVTASSPDGTPQVRMNNLFGETECLACSFPPGIDLEVLAPSGTTWTFSRPPAMTQPAEVGFEAVLAGVISDADTWTIAEQGRDTITLRCKVTELSSSAVSTTVRVRAWDPTPQGETTPLTITVDSIAGLPGGSIIPSAPVSHTGSFTQDYVINRPAFGTGTARVVFQVASSDPQKTEDHDSIDVTPQERDTVYNQCSAQIIATDIDTVTVKVTSDTNTGTPHVAFIAVTGTATLISGPAVGVFVAQNNTDNIWKFRRGKINEGVGQAQFRAHLDGFEDDDAYVPIEEQGRDTVMLGIKLKAITTLPDRVVVRAYVIDPHPASPPAATVTLSYEAQGTGALVPPSPLTLTPTENYSNTGTRDFTVFRPAFASGAGHLVITAAATDRVSAVDSIVVPEVMQDTQPCLCTARITGYTNDLCTITVTATHPNGTPQVKLVDATGPITLVSGHNDNVYRDQNGTDNVWTFRRGGVNAGLGQVQFRSHFAGTSSIPSIDDDDFVEIPDLGQDTRGLTISLESIGSTPTTETVRVKVIDPEPQGAASVLVEWVASGVAAVSPASGQALTPTANLATTGFLDFVITRAAIGNDQGVVKFIASAANRVPDVDSCFINAQRQITFGPTLDVKMVPSPTTVTFTYAFSGTLSLTIDGAVASLPTSPFGVNRPKLNQNPKVYTFICVKDQQTIQDTFVITATGDIPDLRVNPTASSDTTYSYQITATNLVPGGSAPTITVAPTNCSVVWSAVTYVSGQSFNPSSGDTIVVNRPAFGASPGSVSIRASISNGGSESETLPISNQERDTVALLIEMLPLTPSMSGRFAYTIKVTDSQPQGGSAYLSLAYSAQGGLTSYEYGTFSTPASPISLTSGGSHDYEAVLPTSGPPLTITFTVTDSFGKRTKATVSVIVSTAGGGGGGGAVFGTFSSLAQSIQDASSNTVRFTWAYSASASYFQVHVADPMLTGGSTIFGYPGDTTSTFFDLAVPENLSPNPVGSDGTVDIVFFIVPVIGSTEGPRSIQHSRTYPVDL